MTGNLKYYITKWSGIPKILDFYNRDHLLVITYHGLYDGHKRPGSYPNTFVHVDDFYTQLKFLKERYHFTTPEVLQECLVMGRPMAHNSALITFDDGYESFERLALPILRTMNLRAMVFITTDHIDNPQPFWFDVAWHFMRYNIKDRASQFLNEIGFNQEESKEATTSSVHTCLQIMKGLMPERRATIIREMMKEFGERGEERQRELALYKPMSAERIKVLSREVVTFGGHTHTHTILSVMNDEVAESEICRNKSILEGITGKVTHFFAYPNGGSRDFSARHKEMLKRANYCGAFSLTQKRSVPYDDPMDISRFNVAPEDNVLSLHIRLTGFNRFFNQIKHKRNTVNNCW